MKLTMLGTGNALVTECYNTCFVMEDENDYFMVDGGGGNTILKQLKKAGFDWKNMKQIFVTHKHIDHFTGIIWMIRMITQYMKQGEYEGEATIYGHDEVIALLREISKKLLEKKSTAFLDDRLHFVELKDGDHFTVMGHDCVAFDIGSTKDKQFGFTMYYGENQKLTCCGDEPYNACEYEYAKDSAWMLHEAFCLFEQADIFHPYEKHHSTAKDAAELAESLGVKNLVLYHTEDANILNRKELYTAEGKQYFTGNLFVPEDLEVIEIDD